jgi:hypothetical protein
VAHAPSVYINLYSFCLKPEHSDSFQVSSNTNIIIGVIKGCEPFLRFQPDFSLPLPFSAFLG